MDAFNVEKDKEEALCELVENSFVAMLDVISLFLFLF